MPRHTRRSGRDIHQGMTGRDNRTLSVRSTPVEEGQMFGTYGPDDLLRMRLTRPAPPHRRPERVAISDLFLLRGFAPGQEEKVAKLGSLRAKVISIIEQFGGESGENTSELAAGAVLLHRAAFGIAKRALQAQKPTPGQIVEHIRAGQPPTYTETVEAATLEATFFGKAEEGKKQVGLHLGGIALRTEADTAVRTLHSLIGADSGTTVRYDRPMLLLGASFPHIPAEGYDPIREAVAAVFPRGTPWELLPSTLPVPQQPSAATPQA